MPDIATVDIDPGIDAARIEGAIDKGRDRIDRESKGALASLSWPMVRKRLALELRDQLGRGLLPWLGSAWTTVRELHEFKDRTKYPVGSPGFYNMFPQTIEGAIQPKITVRCAGQDIAELPFDVTVTAKFHCVQLIIRDVQIIGFGGGDYEITLKIALYGQDLSGPIELDKSRLPGEVTFSPGLPIP